MDVGRLVVCVPARLDSTRLPRKLLEVVGNQTIIEHVCDRVIDLCKRLRESPNSSRRGGVLEVRSCVVTDSRAIALRVQAKGLETFLSKSEHESGTSRIAEYLRENLSLEALGKTLVVNVQGDEPFLKVADVVRLIEQFIKPSPGSDLAQAAEDSVPVATLVYRNTSRTAFLDPSCVKVVRRSGGMAVYFSRAPVPWPRKWLGTESLLGRALETAGDPSDAWAFWQHLGIYVYRGRYLDAYSRKILAHSANPPCDEIEGLEQLAVLEEGKSIWTLEATAAGHGIDTLRDLRLAREHWHEWLESAQS